MKSLPPQAFSPRQQFEQALALHRLGRVAEAAPLYEAVLKAYPRHFDALHFLGFIRLHQGRADDALALLRRAINEKPNAPEALNNLAAALCALDRWQEAVPYYEKVVALKPKSGEAHNNLGVALRTVGRHPEAIAHFEEALKHGVQDAAGLHRNLGTALEEVGSRERALAALQKSHDLNPKSAATRYMIGVVLEKMGRLDEALAAMEEAIALEPKRGESHTGLGNVLATMGRTAEARAAFERAISLEPANARHYEVLAGVKQFRAGDPHLAAMVQLAEKIEGLRAGDQISLHFALGKALEDAGDRTRAFRHLVAGNALKRRQITYDEAAFLGALERIRSVFTPELLRAKAGCGDLSAAPIFIVGMPRSGTTLIEQILASHPQVLGAGELPDLHQTVTALVKPFPDAVSGMDDTMLHRLGATYLERVGASAPGARRITDKMPDNFRYVGLIHLALPNARIIHARRDPVDTCLSIFSKLFTGNQPFAYELGELGRYYRAYAALMAHWRSILPPGAMLEVDYESVVANLEEEAHRIVAYCGLDWDDACLAFHKTERAVRTASRSQVREPLYNTSVGRWRAYAELLTPLFEALQIPMVQEPPIAARD